MFASTVAEFSDWLVDELAPVTTAEHIDQDESPPDGLRLAQRLASGLRAVSDDEVYRSIVEVDRLRNLVEGVQSQLVATADWIGLTERLHVTTPARLLIGLGVPPAAAHRIARNAKHAASIGALGRGTRDGSLSPEKADAIGKGVAFVEKRVALDKQSRDTLIGRLMAQETPADVAARSREGAIALSSEADVPDAIPVAENASLNEMSMTSNDEGRVVAEPDIDVTTGEELAAALDPLMKPVSEPDGSPDPRTAPARR